MMMQSGCLNPLGALTSEEEVDKCVIRAVRPQKVRAVMGELPRQGDPLLTVDSGLARHAKDTHHAPGIIKGLPGHSLLQELFRLHGVDANEPYQQRGLEALRGGIVA